MLKLKLQYFGHLMWRTDSLEKTLRLGKIEGDDRGWDGWMASPTQWTWVWVNSGGWWWTWLSDWTELICGSLNGMRISQSLPQPYIPHSAVAGSWNLGSVEQSQGTGCCWLWRDRSRRCEGGDCGGKCLWREARQPWKQGDTAESHVGGEAITIASLPAHTSIGSWTIERLAHQNSLKKLQRKEHFQTHSRRPRSPWYQNQRQHKKRKLQANITDVHRCKNPQQNFSTQNSTTHDKAHTPWSSWIYSRVTRIVQHSQINQCNAPH